MKNYAFFDADGDMVGLMIADEASNPACGDAVRVEVDDAEYQDLWRNRTGAYRQNDQIIKRPAMPSSHHDWDKQTKQWVLDTVKQQTFEAQESRSKRNQLLSESDWTDTLSSKARLGAKYDDWQRYRQALRDITNQQGFPLNIVWPTPPD